MPRRLAAGAHRLRLGREVAARGVDRELCDGAAGQLVGDIGVGAIRADGDARRPRAGRDGGRLLGRQRTRRGHVVLRDGGVGEVRDVGARAIGADGDLPRAGAGGGVRGEGEAAGRVDVVGADGAVALVDDVGVPAVGRHGDGDRRRPAGDGPGRLGREGPVDADVELRDAGRGLVDDVEAASIGRRGGRRRGHAGPHLRGREGGEQTCVVGGVLANGLAPTGRVDVRGGCGGARRCCRQHAGEHSRGGHPGQTEAHPCLSILGGSMDVRT